MKLYGNGGHMNRDIKYNIGDTVVLLPSAIDIGIPEVLVDEVCIVKYVDEAGKWLEVVEEKLCKSSRRWTVRFKDVKKCKGWKQNIE